MLTIFMILLFIVLYLFGLNYISNTADGLYHTYIKNLIYLRSEVSYIYIYHICLAQVVISAYLFQKCISGQNYIHIFQEDLKHYKFSVGKLYIMTIVGYAVSLNVQLQLFPGEDALFGSILFGRT